MFQTQILKYIDKVIQPSEGYEPMDRSHIINDECYDICGGRNFVFLKGVYSFLESCLLPRCQEKIRLNTEVENIEWGEKQVKVVTANQVYSADHVIFTPSTGVLKADHQKLFTPKLPADKINAILTQPFGGSEKAYLFFDEAWWSGVPEFSASTEGYDFIASDGDPSLQLKMTDLVGSEVCTNLR